MKKRIFSGIQPSGNLYKDKTPKTIQDRQDALFKSMSAGQKIHLASNFFNFARNLNELNKNGTRKTAARIR
ncbi:MAG: hypothetical protein AUJ32_01440 [Parcubacteria group bacterium CG1_02_40_82]|uniref:Uncharacterized protein n=2 Tax=Candidatus Portnoyibacteriota TaxID=1817913 RepID=A0A2M7IJ64_9BACT|nr:MAG: hypothetical protein AUJ32_01440 [Parcubacteria group bacterium CG1_02_40_82]PIS31267.1 MAG: hypothetical protein COT41_02240 [Candidatus Portnoybacteria bacterium CG08_land_8_20_14_0_20_40_83]PIW76554.1 MAG: hypothetical protein CO001_00750 [Candidatus Portnoybacteria bacterium CG_4_8_14_3_um_filter_40_10]PJA64964.1 MAG: hypothetical protein CO159_00215 [Candidatus Portnoybacteria bacterium CG_4_9_14_3_um_filter_40_10]